ncbi:hypothetical protein BESB_069230 [Besnoitia besnoiti]|uniref:C2H2-type domain-containing protein n=1 Tax=Besnoitia besnoiti TaxID=94643 RepID=A0A2A9MHJ3_BESBE|nr:hypothetical protein BESB_069230 [Besnoitia besnoiti]PFH34890.1 hypothetical protein BESB_069230 [Besnoitia besnoiti]
MAALQHDAPVLSAGTTRSLLRNTGTRFVSVSGGPSHDHVNGTLSSIARGTADSRGTPEGPLLQDAYDQSSVPMGPNGTFVVGMLVRCEECGKKFINSFYLEKHKNKRHRGNTRRETMDVTPPDTVVWQEKDPREPAVRSDVRLGSSEHFFGAPGQTADTATLKPMSFARQSRLASASRVTPRVLSRQLSATRFQKPFFESAEPVVLPDVGDSSQQLKAEMQKEMHEVVKTFHTMLKDELRGLQSQLANIETFSEEVQSHDNDEDEDSGKSTQPAEQAPTPRPSSAPSLPAPAAPTPPPNVRPCPGSPGTSGTEGSEESKALRQAVHALLTFSHREFLVRSQLADVVKHNSKPPPEEIERQLGLSPATISSQLTKSFLTAGFQHYQRSGMTTGNAPQNFEPINCPPALSCADGSCCYHLHKEVPPRRFSLMPKLFRFRDRMRNSAPVNIKFPSSVLANTNFCNRIPPSLPLPVAVGGGVRGGGPYGYCRESADLPQVPPAYSAAMPPCRPDAAQGEAASGYTYTVEEHPSHPYGGGFGPAASSRPLLEIRPYQVSAGPRAQGPSAQQGDGVGNPDHGNVVRLEPESEKRCSHIIQNRASPPSGGASAPLGAAFDAGLTGDGFRSRSRPKSIAESNPAQPGSVGDPPGGELSVKEAYLREPQRALSPLDARGSLASKSAWPAPSSWVSSNAFLPCGADSRRPETHASFFDTATDRPADPPGASRPQPAAAWECMVDASETATAAHDAFANAAQHSSTINGDGWQKSGSGADRRQGSGPWQYMVQDD